MDPGTTRPLAGWCLPTWWPRCCWRLGSRRSSGRSAERRRRVQTVSLWDSRSVTGHHSLHGRGMHVNPLPLGLGWTSYRAIRRSPRSQVSTVNALCFDASTQGHHSGSVNRLHRHRGPPAPSMDEPACRRLGRVEEGQRRFMAEFEHTKAWPRCRHQDQRSNTRVGVREREQQMMMSRRFSSSSRM